MRAKLKKKDKEYWEYGDLLIPCNIADPFALNLYIAQHPFPAPSFILA